MATSAISIIVQAKDQASAVLSRVAGNVRQYSNDMGGMADQSVKATSSTGGLLSSLGGFAKVAGLAAVATGVYQIGTSAVSAAKSSLTAAADFEQALNMFRSVSDATSSQMAAVSARAKELGNDVSLPGVSARDASLAMLELAKAGLSVNDTLAASKGVLSLAKAGQLETAQAAEIAANALNAFNLSGDQATRVADILAAAANASSAGVGDMAYALQMASASAAAMKIPLQDTVAALAEMANNGIAGSDAGTSLKTFMASFTPTSDAAAASMKKLNLSFYDAQGRFVGMREVVRQLQAGTAKLTDQQKAQELQTIFGSDAIRAANILLKEGVAGYDSMSSAVNKSGAAASLAAAQNAGFNGALDNLKSTLETIGITVGTAFLPALTKITTGVANNLEPAMRLLWDTVSGGDPTLHAGEERFIGFARALNVVRDAARTVGDAYNKYLRSGFEALATTVRDKLGPSLNQLTPYMDDIAKILGGVLVVALRATVDYINLVASSWSASINAFFKVKNAIGSTVDWISDRFREFVDFNKSIWDAFVNAASTAAQTLYSIIEPAVKAIRAVAEFHIGAIGYMWHWVKALANVAWTGIYAEIVGPALERIRGAAQVTGDFVSSVWSVIQNSGSIAWANIQQVAANAWAFVSSTWSVATGWFGSVWSSIFGSAAAPANAVRGTFASVFEDVKNIAKGALNWIIDRVNGVIDGLNNVASKVPGAPTLGKLPRFEHGVRNFRGGPAIVGDLGAGSGEIVNLPAGSDVYTNEQSRKMAGGSAITIEHMEVNNNVDVGLVTRELGFMLATR